MKVKTIDLIGPALDWAVGDIEFKRFADMGSPVKKWVLDDHNEGLRTDPYSTNWLFGGPIIEQERMQIDCFPLEKYASKENISSKGVSNPFHGCGPTPLIAAMRCYVASKLGDEVEVPDQLGKT